MDREANQPIEYFMNVRNGAYYLTLINNNGVTKKAKEEPVVDASGGIKLNINYKGKVKFRSIKEIWNQKSLEIDGDKIRLELGPGDCAVLEFLEF